MRDSISRGLMNTGRLDNTLPYRGCFVGGHQSYFVSAMNGVRDALMFFMENSVAGADGFGDIICTYVITL